MSRIKHINLSNFKFFRGRETITLDGKHLLLYGENGSGKSSVFWGLYTLLEASLKTAEKTDQYFKPLAQSDESLVNIYAHEMSCISNHKLHHDSHIEIEDDNNIKIRISLLDSSICGNSDVQESRKATDFINYQSIFKFQEFKNSETPDLYQVFNYSILPYVNFVPYKTVTGEEISNAYEMWGLYSHGPEFVINENGQKTAPLKDSANYTNFEKLTKHFESEFEGLIDFVNINASDIIKQLGYHIKFKLILTPPFFFYREHGEYPMIDSVSEFIFDKDENEVPCNSSFHCLEYKVTLVLTEYYGKQVKISKPQTFLNEAKMAAVAMAIRLAVLKKKIPLDSSNSLKVLVLDDLMISLDMSNRDRLMNLILSDTDLIKYQILFLTHDKGLYNFVHHKITQHGSLAQWKIKEMYVDECDTTKQEYPVIIDGECDSLEKAKKFFEAKDYATTAVYIRQTIEKIFSEAVPDELKKKIEKNMKDRFIPLNNTWQQVESIYHIPADIKELFKQSKLMILNPAAHNQRLSQPIYKRELQNAFTLVDKLQRLNLHPDVLLIEKGKRLVFRHPTEDYSFEFELKSDLIRNCMTGENNPKCKIHTWQYNGTDFYNFSTGVRDDSHSKDTPKLSRLKSSLYSLPLSPPVDEDCFLDNTIVECGVLRDFFA